MENNNTPIVMHDDHMSCEDISIAFSYKSLNLVSFLYPMIWPDKSNRVYEAVRLPIVTGTGMDESWFTRLNYIAIDRKNTRSIQKSGWKFHISLANVDDNIANGWDIAKRYLIMYHTFVFKIIRDEFRSRYSSNKQQAGKIITIYAYYENREPNEWEIIFNQITAEFIKNNIQPGKLPIGNYVVKQSSYFSYRNDKHGFIYDTNNDPYKKITINIPDQPRIENEPSIDEKSNSDDDLDNDVQAVTYDPAHNTPLDETPQSTAENNPSLANAHPQADSKSFENKTAITKSVSNEEKKEEIYENVKSIRRNRFWSNKNAGSSDRNEFCCFKSCVIL